MGEVSRFARNGRRLAALVEMCRVVDGRDPRTDRAVGLVWRTVMIFTTLPSIWYTTISVLSHPLARALDPTWELARAC